MYNWKRIFSERWRDDGILFLEIEEKTMNASDNRVGKNKYAQAGRHFPLFDTIVVLGRRGTDYVL